MTELDREREQLILADRHLVEGEQRISHQREMVASLRKGRAADHRRAEDLLANFEETLVQWQAHRTAIVARMGFLEAEELRKGRAP